MGSDGISTANLSSLQAVSSLMGGSGTVAGLLQQAGGGSGIFSALSSTPTNPVESAQNTQAITQQKNNILTQAVTRLDYIASGQLKPSADWEKLGAYYAQTGQPYVLTLDSKGGIQVTGQADASYDASRYTQAEQQKLSSALDDLNSMFAKQKANDDNAALVKKLKGAAVELDAMALGVVTPQSDWEVQAQLYQTTHTPFKLALDAKGNIIAQDQTQNPDYTGLNAQQVGTLSKAINSIKQDLIDGTYGTDSYQADAASYASLNRNFYLDLDPVYGTVQVKQNTAQNIVPDFLKKQPFANVGADTQWKQQALDLKAAGKGFHLDIGQGGSITVKENNAANVIQYSQSRFSTFSTAGALLSLMA